MSSCLCITMLGIKINMMSVAYTFVNDVKAYSMSDSTAGNTLHILLEPPHSFDCHIRNNEDSLPWVRLVDNPGDCGEGISFKNINF